MGACHPSPRQEVDLSSTWRRPPLLLALAMTSPASLLGQAGPPPSASPPSQASSAPTASPASSLEQRALAASIDAALAQAWREQKLEPAEPADDAGWLRRLSLDLCGTIPDRGEVAAFLADRHADKRDSKIDEYLADRAFAENLSDLWGNLLLAAAPRGPERLRLRPWLEESFARNVPFADVTRDLVASTGRNDQNGGTAFVLAYADEIETLSAVAARTLLGVQIQCAQCHDHPYDRWKQSDFNGFTGFFLPARARKLASPDDDPVFELGDATPEQDRREKLRKLMAFLKEERAPGAMDAVDEPMEGPAPTADDDGAKIDELATRLPAAARDRLQKMRERQERFREARFLDGRPYVETRLLSRRAALAEWMVDPENPWFARAVANRMWDHLFGKGLTEPVDDLTGGRDAILPELLDLLAQEFTKSGTDLRLLAGAMVRTRAYALGNSLEHEGEARTKAERWFAAHPLRPLTAEQVLHALLRATATDEHAVARARGADFEATRAGMLEKFHYVFADDEGGGGDSFTASIPQALYLMNGSLTNDSLRLKRSPMLDGILDETRSDRERLRAIFCATLSRPPTDHESERLARLAKGSTGGAGRGIEDLYWALLNSTEFMTNH
jgi:uncharacterized protein DUF1549/uncharacterized protein DUF1553